MWTAGVSRDAVVLLLLLNYSIIVVLLRYGKYRTYRFYPSHMTFIKYLRKNFISLPVLFYSVLLLFAELSVYKALSFD